MPVVVEADATVVAPGGAAGAETERAAAAAGPQEGRPPTLRADWSPPRAPAGDPRESRGKSSAPRLDAQRRSAHSRKPWPAWE